MFFKKTSTQFCFKLCFRSKVVDFNGSNAQLLNDAVISGQRADGCPISACLFVYSLPEFKMPFEQKHKPQSYFTTVCKALFSTPSYMPCVTGTNDSNYIPRHVWRTWYICVNVVHSHAQCSLGVIQSLACSQAINH